MNQLIQLQIYFQNLMTVKFIIISLTQLQVRLYPIITNVCFSDNNLKKNTTGLMFVWNILQVSSFMFSLCFFVLGFTSSKHFFIVNQENNGY